MQPLTDQQLETSISRMLRVGVSLSALVVFCGGLLYLRAGRTPSSAYHTFSPDLASLRNLRGTLDGSVHLDAASVIQIGLLLLIATPIARVAFCVVGFARQRDLLYVGISFAVLLVLVFSLIQGGR